MAIERLPRAICIPLPNAGARNNHVPGHWRPIESMSLVYAIASGTLRRFAIGLHLVFEMCAHLEGFVEALAGWAATFPTAFRLSFPPLCR